MEVKRTHFDTMTQQLLPHLLLHGSLSPYVTFEIGYAQRVNVTNHLLQITIMTGRKHKKTLITEWPTVTE